MLNEVPKVVTDPIAKPLIAYTPTGEVIATDPNELARPFSDCCENCGKMALQAASELIDFAATPARNMTLDGARLVLRSRVVHGETAA